VAEISYRSSTGEQTRAFAFLAWSLAAATRAVSGATRRTL
jgi:hypothetical protein